MGSNARQIFGVIDLFSGKFTYHHSKQKNADGNEFLVFLNQIFQKYAGQKLYLVIDNGRIHQGPQDFLTKYSERIELVRLPAYSPKFNPIAAVGIRKTYGQRLPLEKLWKKLKQQHLNNRYFESKAAFLKALKKGLRMLQDSPETLLSLMKKWRNLYFKIETQMKSGIEALHAYENKVA